jgi:hypothetical protein
MKDFSTHPCFNAKSRLTHGSASSVYLVLGFLSAKALVTLTPHKRAVGLCGGGVLIVLGLIYGWRGIQEFL